METRLTASVLGLFVTGLDVVLTRKKESEFVWTNPFKLTFVRLLYVLARYLALLIHIGDITISSMMTAKFSTAKQAPEHFCMSMLTFQSLSSQSMLLILHFILMLRVLALYHRSLFIGTTLSLLVIGRFAGVTAGVLHGLTRTPTILKFSGPCLNEMVPGTSPIRNPFLLFVFGELLIQFILHGLAWKRTIWDLRVLSSSRPAWFTVLNRDGLNVFMGMAVAMIAMSVALVKKGMAVVFVFPLWITFLSIAGTRIILNLQTLHSSNETSSTSSKLSRDVVLTTITDVASWDAPWDTTTFIESESEPCSEHSDQDIASL